jgi:site-specific DNA recombinase
MRAAIYARVSTERQERQQTIDSQLDGLRRWAGAANHDLSDLHVFRDEGYSGSRLDRPGLDALRDAVRDGEIDVVGVLAPDRLARRYAYQVLLLEEFRRAGCAVEFLNRAISDDPGDQLLLQIQGAVAEYERALLSERFRRGKLQKARAGQFIGARAPYGYRYLPRHEGAAGQLIVDEAEAEVVRMLYGWLAEEALTLRQILRRLNFGPWFPRCGRRPWSTSTVHHILSDPVYTGTAYSNRYEYRPARKPRSRKPGYAGMGYRVIRPREQWIAIPVPPLVDQEIWDRAQAQLARNATLSFRNNKKHNYLLRCLLTCGECGLAMHGVSQKGAKGALRYYKCAGKDCIAIARPAPCSRAHVKADDLERTVWDHVRSLLGDPDRLLAQFQAFADEAGQAAARGSETERKLRTRLDGLARSDRRLLDAYQTEVISLEELQDRRRQLADQRHALDLQLEQQRRLCDQRSKAQAVMTDLRAFCERVEIRLDDASFEDRQALLQLVIDRIIVHDGSLEIRHVIPLRSPPPGRESTADPVARLRSDRMHPAALKRGMEDPGSRRPQALVIIGNHQLHPTQAAVGELAQEGGPERFRLRGAGGHAQHLAPAIRVDANSQYHGRGDDPAGLSRLQVGGVDPQVRPFALDRPGEKGVHPLVDLLAQAGDLALGDAGRAHGFDEIVYGAG